MWPASGCLAHYYDVPDKLIVVNNLFPFVICVQFIFVAEHTQQILGMLFIYHLPFYRFLILFMTKT